ncbi:MAG TPA: hypothetical protein VFI84_04140 [Candidatus Saccharimonadales bacterium]|nr:hypothetical protein [Candidatus Saccharimonadales bacterium]
MTPVAAQAFSPFGGVDCSKASDSAVCSEHSSGNPLTGPDGVIVKAANIVAIIAGIAAVILIIIGGLKYVTSGGDSNAVGSAKNTVLYALVGLVVIAVAKILITFVVSRL